MIIRDVLARGLVCGFGSAASIRAGVSADFHADERNDNIQGNLQALARLQQSSRASVDDPRNTEGYSSDEPTMIPPDMV